jgi:GNAT superfamily N-acetyltransferase
VALCNARPDFCWSLLRWDYWRWHGIENMFHFQLQDMITLWELNAQVVAVLTPESMGEAYFQIHPAFCAEVSLAEMLDVAETKLSRRNDQGKTELVVWVHAQDEAAKSLFIQRGYERSRWKAEHMRRRSMTQPIPAAAPAPGYTIRALGDESEHPARSWLSWKVFHPDEPDEKYEGWQWYRNVQRVPLYRRDLDLVAVAPSGELAAFCTAWFDDVTRIVVFEPVGTHPDHQQRGLGKAVMAEALRRAQWYGATLATVSSYSPAAHALYEAMGFTDVNLLEPWIREW